MRTYEIGQRVVHQHGFHGTVVGPPITEGPLVGEYPVKWDRDADEGWTVPTAPNWMRPADLFGHPTEADDPAPELPAQPDLLSLTEGT